MDSGLSKRREPDFTTKDSGQRRHFMSGMVRDVQDDKPRFDLIRPKDVPYGEQMLTRLAKLMARGADKYAERNWELAETQHELDAFIASGLRHAEQWACGETDEDHAAAVMFNVIGAELVRYKMRRDAA